MYKLVRQRFDGKLTSIRPPHPKFNVFYKVGDWIEAPVGGLLVFDNLPDASIFRHFFVGDVTIRVFKVKVKNEVDLPPFGLYEAKDEDIVNLWNNEVVSRRARIGEWPSGTRAFKKVKLLGEVHV